MCLQLNLYAWGFQNKKISDSNFKLVCHSFKDMKYLKELELNFSGWGVSQESQETLKTVGERGIEQIWNNLASTTDLVKLSLDLSW